MAIYHLNHRHIGKTSHAPGTAAAAVRYITRNAACRRIDAVGGIPNHPKALEREAARQEAESRKNARICDKFVIALPKEMSNAQQIAVTRAFLIRLTQNGRARAFACHHGDGRSNPHVHVMFFDRDRETGRRVQRMSEQGSTERIRRMWEEVCNAALEREGFTARIDRRSLAAIEAERAEARAPEVEATRGQEVEAAPAPEPEPESEIEGEETMDSDALEPEPEIEGEETMDSDAPGTVIDHLETPFAERSLRDKVDLILRLNAEMLEVAETISQFRILRERLPREQEAAMRQASASGIAAGEAAVAVKRYAAALAEFEQSHSGFGGRLKGFEISIAGQTLFRSAARSIARLKQEEVRLAHDAMVAAQIVARFHSNAHDTAERRAAETAERFTSVERLIAVYGSEQEARNLGVTLKRSRDLALEYVTEAEIAQAVRAEQISREDRDRLETLRDRRAAERQRQLDAGSDGVGH